MIYNENHLLQQVKRFETAPDDLRGFAKQSMCLNRAHQEFAANRTRVPHEQMTFSTPGGKIIDQNIRDEKYLRDPRSEWNMCVHGTTAKGFKGLLDSAEEQKMSAAMVCDVNGWDCGQAPVDQVAAENVISIEEKPAFNSMQMMMSSLSSMCVVVIVLGVMLARK